MGEIVVSGMLLVACFQLFQQIIMQDNEPKSSNRRYRR